MTVAGRTIREAIALAIEPLSGNLDEWATMDRAALKEHVLRWVHDYAAHRGVLLSDSDILSELAGVVEELREMERKQ